MSLTTWYAVMCPFGNVGLFHFIVTHPGEWAASERDVGALGAVNKVI